MVNVGAAIQPFVPNYGQDADDVQFAARSFGGTVFVRESAISVALAGTAEEHRSTLTARFIGASELDVEPGPLHGALANFYIGASSDAWLEDLPSHESVELIAIATGVDVGVDASGRDLRWTIEAQNPAALGDLVWTYDNLQSLELAPDGALLVGLPAYDELGQVIPDEFRTVRVAKPRAWQTGKGAQHSRAANFVIAGDTVHVEVTGAWSTVPVLVEVMTRYSEVRHGQDQQVVDESIWSEGSSDPLIAGSDADATIDVLGVRYDSAGAKITSVTVLGGDGNSSGHGLGLSPNGRVWMSGTTVADDFPTLDPLQPTRAGGRDAVIVELDQDGHVLTSSYYGGPGDDEGEDVEVDSGGVLWLAGKAELPIEGPSFEPGDEFGTSFSDGAGYYGDFFVAAIDTESLDVRGTTCFGGSTSNGDVAVTLDEHGQIWIGQPALPSGSSTLFFPYEQSAPHTGCDRIDEAWGFEALCWKYNIASQSTPGLSYYPYNSNDPMATSEIVSVTQSALLNSFEANPSLFTFNPAGQWEGPWALTASDINTSSSGAEVVIAAALYMHRWGSPVYANGRTPVTVSSIYPDAMGIHQVIFRGNDPSDDPAQACAGFVDNTVPGWQSHPIYQVAENCALNPNLQVHDLEYSYWDHTVNPTAYVSSRWTGSTTAWYMPAPASWYNGVYIGDPPADEAYMVEHIGEYAALVGPTVREDVVITRRWYDAGVLVDESESVESARVNY